MWFTLISSSPNSEPVTSNFWVLGDLVAGAGTNIVVTGRIATNSPADYFIFNTVEVTTDNGSRTAHERTRIAVSASLGDFVWDDLNGDGIQDVGEPGLANVTVNLLLNGTVTDTVSTDGMGGYLFTNLVSSTNYVVEFVMPAGYVFTPRDAGVDSVDSDADPGYGSNGPDYVDGRAERNEYGCGSLPVGLFGGNGL